MLSQLIFFASPWLLPIVMIVVLLLSVELPYRFGRKLLSDRIVDADAWNTVQAGMMTLAAFVLGISFSQASTRFDARRELVVKEANAIGTTWLRADQLPPPQVATFRRILTDYTASRIASDEDPGNPRQYRHNAAAASKDQDQLWQMVSPQLRLRPSLGLSLLMQTLNDTIDVSGEQLEALTAHVPTAIIVLALILITLATLATGIRFARDGDRPPFLTVIYVLSCVVVITMVVDYDRPQSGFVRVDLSPMKIQLHSMQHPE